MTVVRFAAPLLLSIAPLLAAHAESAPPPPPEGAWFGKGQFGFLQSKGNADAESVNGNIDLMRKDGAWKNEIYMAALYGKNSNIVSAERWETRAQSNYNFSEDLFAFGGLRYEHDLFDGFAYQASATGGLGYKLIDSANTQLTVQAGAGYRRLRPEDIFKNPDGSVAARVPHEATGEAIGTAGVDFSHAFTKTTVLTNKFLTEAGSTNTLLHDELALTVKMSEKLALSVGYAVTDNTTPPPTLKKLDTITTINLVFAF